MAQALDRAPETCRQLVSRARKHVQRTKPRAAVEASQGEALARAFFTAAKSGDTAALTQMLAQDVRFVSDGGGKVLATLNPILGRDKVIRLFAGLARKQPAQRIGQEQFCRLNGLPAILNYEPGNILQTTSLEMERGLITAIFVVRNPDKTRHLTLDGHPRIPDRLRA